jgi:Phage portal protein, SPP1 Gp6-like
VPLTAAQALGKANKLYRQLEERRKEIGRLNRYFRGEQPLAYASPEWRDFHAGRYKDFSDNWCGVVGNSPAERLRVNGFRVSDDREVQSADERSLMEDWHRNEMDAQSSQGFLQSIVAKRSYVLVWGDDDDKPHAVQTWEHASQVIVEYDPSSPRRRTAALKAWTDGDDEFATLYTADEVWKYERRRVGSTVVNGQTESGLYVAGGTAASYGDGGWKQRQPAADDTWPISNPLGLVPVVEYPNRPMLGGEPLSDIAGTIAMQDAVNLLWAYLFGAADFASMPARVVMGQDAPKVPILDADGQKIGERLVENRELREGRLLWLTGAKTSIDQFEPSKLDVFTDVINIAVKHIAAQTRTPVHYIVGELQNVNGETLLAGETGLVKKVEEQQLFFGPAERERNRLVALVRGDEGLAEACRTGRVQWADAETRTTAQLADAALKDRSIGFPMAWIAEKRYGLSQPEIVRLMEMVHAEAEDPVLARIMRGNLAAGRGGNGQGGIPGGQGGA